MRQVLLNNLAGRQTMKKHTVLECEKFFSQERGDLSQHKIRSCEKLTYYKLGETGQIIGEVNLKLGLGGERIEIAQITDVHLNFCLPDALEDDEVLHTKQCRHWLSGGESARSIIKAMDVGEYCDQTVVTGDTLDYLSAGAQYLTERLIFERDPEVMCTLGGHDATKEMETGEHDKLSEEELLAILKNFWIHDIFYYSKTLKDKIIVVGLDNGSSNRYFPHQIKALKNDIEKARKENKYILIFQHEPISTGDPKDTEIEPVFPINSEKPRIENLYNTHMCGPGTTDETTLEMYRLITQNADVIKGIFCGHLHSSYYTEIKAFDPSLQTESFIPQFVAVGNPYFGHIGNVVRIIIE